jgi:hypothetical protein
MRIPTAWAEGMHQRLGIGPARKTAYGIRPAQMMKKEEADV